MTFNPALALPLFFLLLICLEIGRRLRARDTVPPSAVIEGAIFTIFGLLLAFTFSGSIARYDSHRQLLNEEANDIGTAYLRLDLLPPATQPEIRQVFRDYTATRINQYGAPAAFAVSPETTALQSRIWQQALAASSAPGANPDATKLLIPALNSMIDISATRQNAFHMHPPAVIYLLLFTLSCGCALLAGLSLTPDANARLHMLAFAAVVALTIYATLDVEYPTRGLIRLSDHEQVLINLYHSMK